MSMNGILKSKNSELKNDMGTLEIEKSLYKQKIEVQEDYIKRLKEDSQSVISQKEKYEYKNTRNYYKNYIIASVTLTKRRSTFNGTLKET